MINLDLRWEKHVDIFKEMVQNTDVLVEPFRPGVMERTYFSKYSHSLKYYSNYYAHSRIARTTGLGLGPDELSFNEKLIYARLTGYGQHGDASYEKSAGHDINYAALSGVLSMCKSPNSKPEPPVNLLADFAGGSMMCVQGILLALIERANSGKGQVIDAAMIDGTAYIASFLWKMVNMEQMHNDLVRTGTNLLDGGAPFYRCYECRDSKFIAVGCLEKNFFEIFASHLSSHREAEEMGLTSDGLLEMYKDTSRWKQLELALESVFRNGATRDEWSEIFDGTDACVTPVLSIREAEQHKHMKARNNFFHEDEASAEHLMPSPAPKLSRTPARLVHDEYVTLFHFSPPSLTTTNNNTKQQHQTTTDRTLIFSVVLACLGPRLPK